MNVPNNENILDMESTERLMFGDWKWELVFTVLPKKCSITEKYSRGFCKMYRAVKKGGYMQRYPYPTKWASVEAFTFAQLQGKSV
jgi:hypothetical protein